MRHERLAAVLAVLFTLSCAEEPTLLTTIDEPCGYGELEYQVATSHAALDVLLVVDPDLVVAVEPRLRALLTSLATGRVDDDPAHRLRTFSDLRVTVVTTREAQRATHEIASSKVGLPFVRFRSSAHGISDDVDVFVERALCRVTGKAQCIEDVTDATESAFAAHGADVFIISAQDACRTGERFFETDALCDEHLTSLIEAWSQLAVARYWYPSFIVGVPEDLTTFEAHSLPTTGIAAHVLGDTRMHASRTGDICEGRADFPVQAAPSLIERLAREESAILSVCSPDYRPLLALRQCDYRDGVGYADPTFRRVPLLDDGKYACEWHEVLPATGLVTRCEQLAMFGRSSRPVAIDDGHEVCVIDQVPESDASVRYGWFMSTQDHSYSSWATDPGLTPSCALHRWESAGAPALTFITEPVPRATMRLRCTTSASTSPAPLQACDALQADSHF